MDAILTKKDGVVSMDKPFEFLCSMLPNGTYTVSVKRKTKPRTLSQNALMWMWFQCMEDNTGQPKEDFHDYYCAKFLSREIGIGQRTYRVAGKTSALNTGQMTDFLNKVQADAAMEFGCVLPLPEDRFYQTFIDHYRCR